MSQVGEYLVHASMAHFEKNRLFSSSRMQQHVKTNRTNARFTVIRPNISLVIRMLFSDLSTYFISYSYCLINSLKITELDNI